MMSMAGAGPLVIARVNDVSEIIHTSDDLLLPA